jgi:hypothetical protein
MPPRGQPPSGSQNSSDRDRILQSLVQAIRNTPRGTRTHHTVNTKKWYRKGTDLWAELVTKYRSAGKISPEDLVKMPAVDNASSFGKRTVCAEFSGMRDDVDRNGRKGRMDG